MHNRRGASGVKTFPCFTLPVSTLGSNTHMLVSRTENGPAAGLAHEVFDTIGNTPDERKKVIG